MFSRSFIMIFSRRAGNNFGIKCKISGSECRILVTEFRGPLRNPRRLCYSFCGTVLRLPGEKKKWSVHRRAHHVTRMSDACTANWYPCFTACNATWCITTSRIRRRDGSLRRREWIITRCTSRRARSPRPFLFYLCVSFASFLTPLHPLAI